MGKLATNTVLDFGKDNIDKLGYMSAAFFETHPIDCAQVARLFESKLHACHIGYMQSGLTLGFVHDII